MPVRIVEKDDQDLLNLCTQYLSRAGDPSASAEAWRFPVIDVFRGSPLDPNDPDNEVVFIYKAAPGTTTQVGVLGSFATLYEAIPLKPVRFLGEDTGYFGLSVAVPKGQAHIYQYVVDGKLTLDPINPQRVVLENGKTWSRFFTDSYLQPMVLELWELKLLYRLTEQILPFRVAEAELFLQQFYNYLDRQDKDASKVYRLDESVGEVNAIDKLLAREERHRLNDYHVCLKQIDTVLRKRNPYMEPSELSKEFFNDLYNDMAQDPQPREPDRRVGLRRLCEPVVLPEHPEAPRRHGGVLAPEVCRERRGGRLGIPVREVFRGQGRPAQHALRLAGRAGETSGHERGLPVTGTAAC